MLGLQYTSSERHWRRDHLGAFGTRTFRECSARNASFPIKESNADFFDPKTDGPSELVSYTFRGFPRVIPFRFPVSEQHKRRDLSIDSKDQRFQVLVFLISCLTPGPLHHQGRRLAGEAPDVLHKPTLRMSIHTIDRMPRFPKHHTIMPSPPSPPASNGPRRAPRARSRSDSCPSAAAGGSSLMGHHLDAQKSENAKSVSQG